MNKSNKKKNDDTLFYEDLINSGWTRDNEGAIILGVSPTISNKFHIPVLAVNIIFILLLFTVIGSLPYLILGYILPVVGVDYSGMTSGQYLLKQLKLFIRDIIVNSLKSLGDLIVWLPKKFCYFISVIFKFIMKYFLPIIRFFFFALIGITLFSIFISLLVVGALYFSSFSFNNIDFSLVLPDYTLAGVILGIFSSGVFTLACFVFAISNKWLNKYILTSALIAFIVSIFLGFATMFHLVNTYSDSNTYTINSEMSLDNITDKDLVINLNGTNRNDFISFIELEGSTSVTLANEESNNLRVNVEYNYMANEEISNIVQDSFDNITMSYENGVIKIDNERNRKTKIPPIPFTRDITIYVPRDYTIRFDNYAPWLFYVTNAHLSNEYGIYSPKEYINCSSKTMWYSETEERFICELDEVELENAKKEYIKDSLIVNFDTISPLRHKDEYKREYRNGGIYSDWEFGNFYWLDSDTLNIEFSDMSLDVRASLKVQEELGNIQVSDFKINFVNIRDYVFNDKYYVDISPIQSFLGDRYIEIDSIENMESEIIISTSAIPPDTNQTNTTDYETIYFN